MKREEVMLIATAELQSNLEIQQRASHSDETASTIFSEVWRNT